MDRRLLMATALAAGALALPATTSADEGRVWICHGTASQSNPYVLIGVAPSAVAGHFDGTAPGHGKNNYPDIYIGAKPESNICNFGE